MGLFMLEKAKKNKRVARYYGQLIGPAEVDIRVPNTSSGSTLSSSWMCRHTKVNAATTLTTATTKLIHVWRPSSTSTSSQTILMTLHNIQADSEV